MPAEAAHEVNYAQAGGIGQMEKGAGITFPVVGSVHAGQFATPATRMPRPRRRFFSRT